MAWDKKAYHKQYRQDNRMHRLVQIREMREKTKVEVLTHYGRNGTLVCCYQDCTVIDVDMLTLDHINDDGAADRKANKVMSGNSVYIHVRKAGYPVGFQTLCWNHQWKKRILRCHDLRIKDGK